MPPSQTYSLKRPADSDPEGEPPIKKFGLLQIGPTEGYIHGRISSSQTSVHEQSTSNDSMLLDDTPHTTYIYDIDHELSELEAQEKQISFLPDIEKTLNAIPKSVLEGPKSNNNELVLYRLPTSLTIPEEYDSVRKAIKESRARSKIVQSGAERSHDSSSETIDVDEDRSTKAQIISMDVGDCMEVDSQ